MTGHIVFLIEILTPTNLLENGQWAEFQSDPSALNWASGDPSQYSTRIQNALSGGATRTFGSAEVTPENLQTIRNRGQGSADTNGYVEEISGSGGSVFLMTEPQFAFARGLQ